MTTLLPHPRQPLRLALLAAVTLLVPTTVLGLLGLFRDHGADPVGFSWSVATWLVAPYVVLAALCLWAARSGLVGFRTAVEVTTAVIVVQSVALSLVSVTSDQDLAAVGVLFSPVLYLGAAVVLAVVGLVQHLTRDREIPAPPVLSPASPVRPVSPAGRS